MSRQRVYLLGRQGVRGSNPLSSTEAGPKGSYSNPAEFDGAHAGGNPPLSPLTSRLASRSRRSAVRVAAGRARPASSSGFGEPFPAERTINLALQPQTRLMRGRIARCRAEPPLPASVGRSPRPCHTRLVALAVWACTATPQSWWRLVYRSSATAATRRARCGWMSGGPRHWPARDSGRTR
jgi:hypothetical protein